MIHSTAVIHPKAQVDPSCSIGAYAVIDEDVVMGPNCYVGPHVYITGITTLGARNRLHAGCVIGNAPQDLKYKGEATRLRIGDDNTFRENVTVNRANTPQADSMLGSNNLLMAGCHVGHDCHLGSHVIIANGALLGGHVLVDDRAFISGNCLVHQFVRIGTLAMMQGGSGVSKDLPPFTVARGDNGICGLNTVGLRRAGYTSEARTELRKLYQALFRSRMKWAEALAAARAEFTGEAARVMLDFVAAAKRGICSDTSVSSGTDDTLAES